MSRELAEIRFAELLPSSIAGDSTMQAAAAALDVELAKVNAAAPAALIYSRLEDLPEELLDLLAWQFHADWWDRELTLTEKRELVALAILAHRYKGTKWAIEAVIGALGLNGQVAEWFEYAGEPYTFRVEIGVSDREITPALQARLEDLVGRYKNVRSWLDEVLLHYQATHETGMSTGAAGEVSSSAAFNDLVEQIVTRILGASPGGVGEVSCSAAMSTLVESSALSLVIPSAGCAGAVEGAAVQSNYRR